MGIDCFIWSQNFLAFDKKLALEDIVLRVPKCLKSSNVQQGAETQDTQTLFLLTAQSPNTPKSPAEPCQKQNLFLIISFPVVSPPLPPRMSLFSFPPLG